MFWYCGLGRVVVLGIKGGWGIKEVGNKGGGVVGRSGYNGGQVGVG